MKLGIHLRQRCRIYFVAAERELPLAMALHRSHTFHQLPKNVSLCHHHILRDLLGRTRRSARAANRFQVAARHVECGLDCGLADRRKDSGLSPLDGGGASSRQILLIERLTDQRLDDRLSTDVQLLGSPVQFFQHARREVHIHPLDWTHHAPLVGEEP